MDEQLSEYLRALYEQGQEHDSQKTDRLEPRRNLEPDSARLLALLVVALKARRLLELGTSNGYSTLWLADAARTTGGSVISVDIDPVRSAQAREHLTRTQLQDYVQLQTEDGATTLSRAEDHSLDMIFLNAERPAYPSYWPEVSRVLRPGGMLVLDNALSHAEEVRPFREILRREDRATEVLLRTGAGLLLVLIDPN
jgi:predicted O-methyltransferase YrrM